MLEPNFGFGNPCPQFVQLPFMLTGQRVISVQLVYLVQICFCPVISLGPQFTKMPCFVYYCFWKGSSIKIILI